MKNTAKRTRAKLGCDISPDTRHKLIACLEIAPDGAYIIDLEGVFLYGNKQSEELTGYKKEELVGKSYSEANLLPQKYLAKVAELLSINTTGEPAGPDELEMIRKDGKHIWVEVSTIPVKQRDGISIIIFVHDISERKRTEEELRKIEENYRALVENTTDLIFMIDKDNRVLSVNKSATHIFRKEAGELVGKSIHDLFPQEVAAGFSKDLKQVFEKGARQTIESIMRVGEKEWWISTSLDPVRGHDHEVVAVIGVTRDITEQKKAGEIEKQLRNELDVSSRLALIGEMASGIAHEINNPLTGVIGFAQLLMNQDVHDDVKEGLEVINHEAQRVAKIVAGLLTFAHQRKPGQESVDINELILEVLNLRSYEMEVHNIKAATKLAPDLPSTIADGSQLQQVFLNIVINAEQIMTEAHGGGKLYIKTERLNNSIRISFTDDGPGISKENLDKIFHPFFTTKGVGKGTGLGLSVCHGIITRHNGKIYAKSEPGRGATFVVELPAAADTKPEGDSKTNGGKALNLEGTTILVVDDERAILTFLNRLLSEWGYEVKTVDNATDALERLKTESYSAILLDIKMPKMSGIELYQNIKEVYPALAQRVMFITGDVLEKTTNDFLTKNKVPNITKPIDIDKLTENINRILGGKLAQSKTR